MTVSLVTLGVLSKSGSSKSGQSYSRETIVKSLGGKEHSLAIEKEIQNLLDEGYLIGLMHNSWVQRTKKGDEEIAKAKIAELAKKIGIRILAEVPDYGSDRGLKFDLLAKCLEVLGIQNGKKEIQDLIDAGYLALDHEGTLSLTAAGDQELKKIGRPYQRKR